MKTKDKIKTYSYDFVAQVAILLILTEIVIEEQCFDPLFGPSSCSESINWDLIVPLMVISILINVFLRKKFGKI